MKPKPIAPGPGQESVWDYPRPPALEPVDARITVELGGRTIVDTTSAYRVLETSHPPTYYIPPADIDGDALRASGGRGSFCEWKGQAQYWDVCVGDRVERRTAWSYPSPTGRFSPIADHVAFYAGRMDRCTVDGEVVTPQPGGFYGGWITSTVVGPFKGAEGTWGW